MKKILILLLLFFSHNLIAQNYKLFHAGDKKLFSEFPVNQKSHSLSLDSVISNGSDSVYFNFFNINSTQIISDTCQFWGSANCNPMDVPSWIGRKIIYNNINNYRFYTNVNDSINFTFNTDPTDTVSFFIDATQEFSTLYEKSDTISFFGIIDSARFYKILHTDLLGNPIGSILNQQYIITGKNLGFIRFFEIGFFPDTLQPISAIGDENHSAGLYALTNEKLYDYQPGDIIQYREIKSYSNYPPWLNYDRFRKYEILSRNVTLDSMIYSVRQTLFYVDSTYETIDTISLKFHKHYVVQSLPYEQFKGPENYQQTNGADHSFSVVNYCGEYLWTATEYSNNNLKYCAIDNCWGQYDTGGPPPETEFKYVEGIGVYYHDKWVLWFSDIEWENESIVYFKKNGIACGTELILSASENLNTSISIVVSPNPAADFIQVSSYIPISGVSIINLQGQKLLTEKISDKGCVIDIRTLNAGLYFAIFEFNNRPSVSKRIIVIK
ncbi:MAG: T9SS type A sorting domain-containing protein [Bacteroidota bacterium]